MITPELELIRVFLKELDTSMTINQLSKELKKSYAYTNGYARKLIDAQILEKKVVGSAILCSLNFGSDKTLALLSYFSAFSKTELLKETKMSPQLKLFVDSVHIFDLPGFAYSLFLHKDTPVFVCEDKKELQSHLNNITKIKFKIIDKTEFKLSIKSFDMSKLSIIEGHEAFWKLISKVV